MEIIAYLTMFIDHIVKFLAPNYYSTNPILRKGCTSNICIFNSRGYEENKIKKELYNKTCDICNNISNTIYTYD